MDIFAVGGTLNRKIRFLTPRSETGSMTGWGVTSSIHSVSTIRSYRTTEIVVDRKQAVSAGIFAGIFRSFGLQRRLRSFRRIFSHPSLQQKIPFPAAAFDGQYRSAARDYWESLGAKSAPSQTRFRIIAD
jgi:hypothetical protein